MLKFIKTAALAALLAGSAIAPSHALVTDPNKIQTERTCGGGQSVCYMRVTVNYNDPRISSGVWFDTIPKNAYVLAIDAYVSTAFNAGTTNTLSMGATATGTDFLATSGANASVTMNSATVQHLTSAAGLATVATGNTSLQTAINGAVPMYVRYAQTGTAATAGSVTIVVTYAQNNDE